MASAIAPPLDTGPAFTGASRARAALLGGLVAAIVVALALGGYFRPLDDRLAVARAQWLNHPVTGSIATLEIDSASLQAARARPWPPPRPAPPPGPLTPIAA